MADVKWIKVTTDIFDNRKFKVIEAMPEGDAITVIWFKLLCLAGSTNDDGLVYFTKEIPFTDELMASVFNKPLATVRLALNTFLQFGMIDIVEDIIHISNWEKYQNIQGMELIREQNRIRQKRWYDNHCKRLEEPNVSLTSPNGTDKNKKENENKKEDTNVSKKENRWQKPTVSEIKAYCSERHNGIDAEEFYDFYESKGWMVGKNHMKDWKACVRTWEHSSQQNQRARVCQDDDKWNEALDENGEVDIRRYI